MREAVVNPANLIDNVIELADGAIYPLAQGWQLIADPNGLAAPGGTWNGSTFLPPAAPTPSNRDIITARALAALAANDTFLAVASPSNTQVSNQVKALTRECNGLIRLLLNQLDSTADT